MKKNAVKRAATAMLALALLLLAACGGQPGSGAGSAGAQPPAGGSTAQSSPTYVNKEGYPICDETITVTVSGPRGVTPDWNGTVLVEEVAKRLGIQMNCQPVEDDAWSTQFTLMLSSDSLPDFITNTTVSTYEAYQYGQDGYFLKINDYMNEYAPNLLDYFAQYPELESAMTSEDGNVYGIRSLSTNKVALLPRSWVRRDWLESAELELPKTLDDLTAMLTAFRDEDVNGNGDNGDEIPMSIVFSSGSGEATEAFLLSAHGLHPPHNSLNCILLEDGGQISLGETTDNYKAYLKYMNMLYTEGLLDSESFIQTADEYNGKQKEERVGVFNASAPYVGASREIDYDRNFMWIGGLTSEWNTTPTVTNANRVGNVYMALISASTQYPEALVRLFDYFYTDEGTRASRMGYEGISREYEDVVEIPGAQIMLALHPEGYDSREHYRTSKAIIGGGFQFLNSPSGIFQGVLEEATDEQIFSQPVLDRFGWAVLLQQGILRNRDISLIEPFPSLVYSDDEQKTRNTLRTDIELYITNSKAQFITGEVDVDAGWDNFQNTLKQMGLDELLAIEQAAYSRYAG